MFHSDAYDKETVDDFEGGAYSHCAYVRAYVCVYVRPRASARGLRCAVDGRVAVTVKRDREHSDWPIVVQRSDNAGNWPSLDKTAK